MQRCGLGVSHPAPTWAATRRRWRGLLLACAAGLAPVGPAGGQTSAGEDSLRVALGLAYETNPQLLEAREQLRQTNELRPAALGGWLPDLRAVGSVGRQKESFRNLDGNPVEKTRLANGSLELSLNLLRGGGDLAELRAAENRIREEQARYTAVEQVVLFEAAQAYADVFRDQAALNARESNVQYLTRVVEVTQELYDLDDRTEGDLAQARGRLAEATSELAFARGTLAGARATYRRTVGEAPTDVFVPAVPVGLPASEDEVVREASLVNPDVVASGFAERAARDDVAVAASGLLPSVDVLGTLDYTADELLRGADRRIATSVIQGVLTIPLYQQGVEYAQLRQAKAAARQSRATIFVTRDQVIEQALRFWHDAQAAAFRIPAQERAVAANEVAVASVAEEVQVGRRPLLDLLDTQRDLTNAKVSLAAALRDRAVASFGVLLGVGRLTARDLTLPVDHYDVERDYDATKWKLFGPG